MKRLLILLILLFALPAYAEQCTEDTPCPELARLSPAMMGSVPAVATGDGCGTNDLLFSWHAENVDVTLGTPAGCSLGDTVATAVSAVEISNAQAKDGTYSVYVATTGDRYTFDVSSEDIAKGEVGRFTCWFRVPDVTTVRDLGAVYVDGTHYIRFVLRGDAKARITVLGAATVHATTTDSYAANTWTFFWASWSDAGVGGKTARVGINTTGETPSFVESETDISDIGSPGAAGLVIGDWVAGAAGAYIDLVKIYGAW